MNNLDTQIRDYFEEIAPPHEGDYRSRRLVPYEGPRRLNRPWLAGVAAAAAIVTVLGLAIFLSIGGPDPAVTVPTAPATTVPSPSTAPTLVPSTTLPGASTKEGFVPVDGWEEIPDGSASSTGISDSSNAEKVTALVIGPDQTPFAAWESRSPESDHSEIYVKAFLNGDWVEAGTGSATGGGVSNTPDQNSLVPSLASSADGSLYVAWEEQAAEDLFRIYVKRFNGEAWEEAGTGSATGDGVSEAARNTWQANLAIAPDGTVFLAWGNEADDLRSDLYVKMFNGVSWEEVGAGSASGGGVTGDGAVGDLDLAVTNDGSPVAMWTDPSQSEGAVHVRIFDGSSWIELGEGSATGRGLLPEGATEPNFVNITVGPTGEVYAAWNHIVNGGARIHAMAYTDGSWSVLGDPLADGASSVSDPDSPLAVWPTMAVSADGFPAIVWQAIATDIEDGGFRIFVKRLINGQWVELGSGSGSGGGLSGGTEAVHGSIAFDRSGDLYLVFVDQGIGIEGEIAALRWGSDS